MSNFITVVITTSVLLSFLFTVEAYKCQKCVTEGTDCFSANNPVASNCDYCVKLDGTVTDTTKVPDLAKSYLKQNHPDFKLRNGQHIVGRGCITKAVLKQLDFNDAVDCVKILPEDNVGFKGNACSCLGNC